MLLTVTALASSCLFLLCYRYDSKYTVPGPQPVQGVLHLSGEDLQRSPVLFLLNDWEIYRDTLLAPADFAHNPPTPDEFTFIGQYKGFEGGDRSRSPHGSATYRLRIALPPEMDSYTLELPEIYSAYTLYLNGRQLVQMGDPNPASYRAQTGNRSVSLQAADSLEILLAVSDYSYLYSGLIYPPAFGLSPSVTGYLNVRLVLRTAVIAIALCIGLLSLCIRALTRKGRVEDNGLLLLYGLLCFCLVGVICYPVVKTLSSSGIWWYTVENICRCVLILLVILIQHRISGFGRRATTAAVLLGLFVCCFCAIVSLLPSGNLLFMLTFSRILRLYTYVSVAFLTASAAYALFRGTIHSPLMMAGIVAFDCALLWERLLPVYEPIVTGWFREIGGCALVGIIGVIMAGEVARQYRMKRMLEEQMDTATRMMAVQREYYPQLLEKEQQIKTVQHDMRYHLSLLRQLVAEGNLESLAQYLDEFQGRHLQTGAISFCNHYAVDMILRLYAGTAERKQIDLSVTVQIPPRLDIEQVDLCVVLGNLLENAVEACEKLPPDQRWLKIGILYKRSRLSIVVDNSYDGAVHLSQGRLYSRKRKHSMGIGLLSVEAVTTRYGGRCYFYPDPREPIFHSEISLVLSSEDAEPIHTHNQ
ncbi:GHKL domain-containing protein [Ruminococcaceae bacterium OttesenSCG-928-L11]|nr:GHKL domain-containing protein [Ruminococcaceae bacterium OttesenSCG-928-L11]